MKDQHFIFSQFLQTCIDGDPAHPGHNFAICVNPVYRFEYLYIRFLYCIFSFLVIAEISHTKPHQSGSVGIDQLPIRIFASAFTTLYDFALCQGEGFEKSEFSIYLKLTLHRPVTSSEWCKCFDPETSFEVSFDPGTLLSRKMSNRTTRGCSGRPHHGPSAAARHFRCWSS